MLTTNELHQIFREDPELNVYVLSNDAIVYVDYCLQLFKGRFQNRQDYLRFCDPPGELFSKLRQSLTGGSVQAFYSTLVREMFREAEDSRDVRYDNLITAFDVMVGICFDDELYSVFSSRVPIFPYQTQRIFLGAIRLSFGDPYELPQEFVIPFLDYLRSTLALFQTKPLEEQQHIVNQRNLKGQLNPIIYHAPLNVAGEYCTQICEDLLDRFQETYGSSWDQHLNFLTLLKLLET